MDVKRTRQPNKPKKVGDNIVVDQRKYKGKKVKKTEYPVDLTDTFEELDEGVISVKEGTDKYVIEARDPYHHCFIVGPNIPDSMKGAYTTYTAAKAALDDWLDKEGK
jgi:hypothetical protein